MRIVIKTTGMTFFEAWEAVNGITMAMPDLPGKLRNRSPVENLRIMHLISLTPQKDCGECKCDNCVQFVIRNCIQSVMKPEASPNTINVSDCPYLDTGDAEIFKDLISEADEEYWRYCARKGIFNQ